MTDKKAVAPGGYEIVREGAEEVMRLNYESVPYSPSIEENPYVMMDVIDKLVENPSIGRLTFMQRRHYNYEFDQTQLLMEFANLYSYLVKRKKALSPGAMGTTFENPGVVAERHSTIRYIVFELLRSDPLGAFVELKRLIRLENIKQKRTDDSRLRDSRQVFLDLLQDIFGQLEKTKLVQMAMPYLAGYTLGDRTVYKLFFRPTITPDFLFTKLMARPPLDGEEMEIYSLDKNTDVTIFSTTDDIKFLYHLNPPEFKLSEDKYALVDLAKSVLAEHQPKEEAFLDPGKMRTTFFNIGSDLLRELAEHQNLDLTVKEINELTEILIRHTIGFGFIEILLKDERIQDVSINAPNGDVPIFVLHGTYDNCVTNIIPSRSDAESWATKFRLLSGRPLDEANPILDTELQLPQARARVSMITKPLNPYGLAYSFRRHRDKPWTLALFAKQKMINTTAAGVLSFLIDGSRTMLVAGTRSSGKTSLLGACLVEIMRKYRILTIEDSVTGDAELIIKDKSGFDRLDFDSLFERYKSKKSDGRDIVLNPGFDVFCIDKNGKLNIKPATRFIRHFVNKPIYEVTTATGRVIKATSDHSLFKLGEDKVMKEVKTSEMKENDFLAVPRCLPLNNKTRNYFEIDFNNLDANIYVKGKNFNKILNEKKKLFIAYGKSLGYAKVTLLSLIRKGLLPLPIAKKMGLLKHVEMFKSGHNSLFIPSKIRLDKVFLEFLGLWLADGCYDRNSVIVSVSSEEERDVVRKVAERFDLKTAMHSDKFSLMIHSKSFKFLLKDILGLKGNAYTKRIPGWVFNLSNEQIASFLRGLFSGDGCASDKEIAISLASPKLLSDIQSILLNFGIIFRINLLREHKFLPNDRTKDGRISSLKSLRLFKQIGFLQQKKNNNLAKLLSKVSVKDTTDVVPLPLPVREKIAGILTNLEFNKNDYLNRGNNIGREKLKRIASLLRVKSSDKNLVSYITKLSECDLFWDRIVRVKEVTKPQYVYDISVPGDENFIANNILAHNTIELPSEALREMGYDIQPLKVRSALVESSTELSATEGIRTSLRLGDSALIVGEVRSKEAIALYEAMRIGALANVVAGTIHGDSPYGVFDRVVNDLGVPRTSFKATDIIIVANPLKSPDGLHKWRRVTQITEVRKEWEDDPLREGGFVDLMKYNAHTDQLELTPELMNGDSEVIKSIGSNVKEWAGNWDAIWENIMLRADIKKKMIEYSGRTKNDKILEAPFVIRCNDQFHRISNTVREDIGALDSKRILFEWEEWLKRVIRKGELPK
ncbi:MAG: ATPase, T2SS/T4P/T4SS family [Candidatus Woesearchaeota archaeon]